MKEPYIPKLGVSTSPTFPMQFAAKPDLISLASTPIEYIDYDGKQISNRHSTGFFYRLEGRVFLVSARHSLSGLDAFMDQPISPDGYLPRQIVAYPAVRNTNNQIKRSRVVLSVRCSEGLPLWKQDPEFDRLKVDIAAVEIIDPQFEATVCVTEFGFEDHLMSSVGFDCFIVGYPIPTYHLPYLPIWRRGSLAYEPEFPVDDKPLFLVDGVTSPGMSGSAIFQRWHGPAPFQAANGSVDVKLDAIVSSRFIGVYGGRLGSSNELAQVGYGWYANRIPFILAT